MIDRAIDDDYMNLVKRFPLLIIDDAEMHKGAMIILNELMLRELKGETLSAGEDAYWKVLNVLIGSYESKTFKTEHVSPREMVKFLMEQNNLKQIDMIEIFGTQSGCSMYLNGKRELTLAQMRALGKRFNVNPSLFMD